MVLGFSLHLTITSSAGFKAFGCPRVLATLGRAQDVLLRSVCSRRPGCIYPGLCEDFVRHTWRIGTLFASYRRILLSYYSVARALIPGNPHTHAFRIFASSIPFISTLSVSFTSVSLSAIESPSVIIQDAAHPFSVRIHHTVSNPRLATSRTPLRRPRRAIGHPHTAWAHDEPLHAGHRQHLQGLREHQQPRQRRVRREEPRRAAQPLEPAHREQQQQPPRGAAAGTAGVAVRERPRQRQGEHRAERRGPDDEQRRGLADGDAEEGALEEPVGRDDPREARPRPREEGQGREGQGQGRRGGARCGEGRATQAAVPRSTPHAQRKRMRACAGDADVLEQGAGVRLPPDTRASSAYSDTTGQRGMDMGRLRRERVLERLVVLSHRDDAMDVSKYPGRRPPTMSGAHRDARRPQDRHDRRRRGAVLLQRRLRPRHDLAPVVAPGVPTDDGAAAAAPRAHGRAVQEQDLGLRRRERQHGAERPVDARRRERRAGRPHEVGARADARAQADRARVPHREPRRERDGHRRRERRARVLRGHLVPEPRLAELAQGEPEQDLPAAVAHRDAGRLVPLHLGRARRHVVHVRAAALQPRVPDVRAAHRRGAPAVRARLPRGAARGQPALHPRRLQRQRGVRRRAHARARGRGVPAAGDELRD